MAQHHALTAASRPIVGPASAVPRRDQIVTVTAPFPVGMGSIVAFSHPPLQDVALHGWFARVVGAVLLAGGRDRRMAATMKPMDELNR